MSKTQTFFDLRLEKALGGNPRCPVVVISPTLTGGFRLIGNDEKCFYEHFADLLPEKVEIVVERALKDIIWNRCRLNDLAGAMFSFTVTPLQAYHITDVAVRRALERVLEGIFEPDLPAAKPAPRARQKKRQERHEGRYGCHLAAQSVNYRLAAAR